MSRRRAPGPGIVALAGVLLAGCSRCGPGPMPGPDPDIEEAPADDPVEEPARARLPKHDWNGITVMMHEEEVRKALGAIGFDVVPSKATRFPLLDAARHEVKLLEVGKFSPSVIVLETLKRRGECQLNSVYGVKLWFHANRLYAFEPSYHADPVDLVEPGDVAVPPGEMEKRLAETFGPPGWRKDVEGGGGVSFWSDEDLVLVFDVPAPAGPPSYSLTFVSHRGNELLGKLVSKLKPR